MTPRGHPVSGIPLKNTKLWHAGCIDDALLVLKHLLIVFKPEEDDMTSNSNAKVFFTGFSASSNIIYKTIIHISENYENFISPTSPVELIGGMCCCANYNYGETKIKLESTFVGLLYSYCLTVVAKTFIYGNQQIHDPWDEEVLANLKAAKTISEYDEAAYSTLGYSSCDELVIIIIIIVVVVVIVNYCFFFLFIMIIL